MGVLGLIPFLQKTCPQLIKKLPDRLRSLRGKTIVFDATLITQRLHFAPMPHPHRHVFGWHRILTELQECGVHAICVFDGHERSAAKAREVARRREIRRMDSARGSLEVSRLNRLQRLMRLLPHYRSLPAADRQCIISTLANTATSALPLTNTDQDALQHYGDPWRSKLKRTGGGAPNPEVWSTPPTRSELPQKRSEPHFYAYGGFTEKDLNEALEATAGESHATAHQHVVPEVWQDKVEQDETALASDQLPQSHCPFDDPDAASPIVYWGDVEQDAASCWSLDMPSISMGSCPPSEDIRSALSALYSDYRRSLIQLTSIPSPFDVPVASDFIPHPSEARIEYAMSKSQLQMTMDEGRIWQSFATSQVGSLPLEMEETLASLARKSTAISFSYLRRTNYPSPETYEECKEIMNAMGVACIQASAPFEAEALASSLVIHGPADFVASEDTDVLVYEAPLMRNIANRDSPLIVISGSEARHSLELDRPRYIDFVLLLGTDFSQRIKNIGPHRALKLIREYGSIENVVEHEAKYPPRIPIAAYLAQVEVARMVFGTLPPVPAPELLQSPQADPAALSHISQKYQLHQVFPENCDYQAALLGNYFGDNPCTSHVKEAWTRQRPDF